MSADPPFGDLIDAVANGDAVDWPAVEANAGPDALRLMARLKTIAAAGTGAMPRTPPAVDVRTETVAPTDTLQLVERALPQLRQWAHGRVRRLARTPADTEDLVQEAVLRALPKLESSEVRHPAAVQAYLRAAVTNRIHDELRQANRRGLDEPPDGTPGSDRYEKALETLPPADRIAIVARVVLQLSYAEVAIALGTPNAVAAWVAVVRARTRLAEAMRHER